MYYHINSLIPGCHKSLHKLLVYPPFAYILYDTCSEDVTGEYSSAKYQWRNLGNILGAVTLPSREKCPILNRI